MTEIIESIREVEIDDEAAEIAEKSLSGERVVRAPSTLSGEELYHQLGLRWKAIYIWQKNVEWHQRQLKNKQQRKKTLLRNLSRGHHRYKRLTRLIIEQQFYVQKRREQIVKEQNSLPPYEEEARRRLNIINWQYTFDIDQYVIFQHP